MCIRENHRFESPEKVRLATGSSMGRLENAKEPEGKLHVASLDVQDCFYHLGLPEELRPYFCLPRVRPAEVGLVGDDWDEVSWVVPRFAVLPMGWTWSLLFAELILQRAVSRAGLGAERRVEDFASPPPPPPGEHPATGAGGAGGGPGGNRGTRAVHTEHAAQLVLGG